MTPLELLAVLVLAGAIVVLIYYYLEDQGNRSFSMVRTVIMETGQKARSTVSSNGEKVNDINKGKGVGDIMSGINEKASGIGEKARTVVSGVGEKVSGTGENTSEGSMMDSVSEKVSGVSDKLKGTVKGVPKSTDNLSNKIDIFLNDKSDQLVKDWELATKDDILDIDKRYNKVKRDIGELDNRFNEYRGFTNKKIKKIEERLDKLEKP
jgi:hypothetical protein